MQKIDKFNENFFEYQQNMMSMCLKLQMDQFNTLNDWFDGEDVENVVCVKKNVIEFIFQYADNNLMNY